MAEQTISDTVVIEKILKGDKNSYALLIKKYNRLLYRICKGYRHDEADIEDIMQDTYIKAFEHLANFKGNSSFGTWVTRILINENLQKIRNKRKKPVAVLAQENDMAMKLSDQNDPEKNSLRKELGNMLEHHLEALPENFRIVFLLREVERMNVAETADVLSISENNVKVRLNRAKEMLRNSLLSSYPIEELYEFNLNRCSRVAANVMSRI